MNVHPSTLLRRLPVLLAVVALLATACARNGDTGATGDRPATEDGGGTAARGDLIAGNYDFADLEIRFGSKDFTEQLVLGQIAKQALEAGGATVRLTENLPSPAGTRDALLAGQIDAAWEYTGTAWINYLGHTEPLEDPMEQFEAVKQEDLEKNNVFWAPPAPFNDTYGFAYREEAEDEFRVETISDLKQFVQENPDRATLCVDNNFTSRDDGLPIVERVYDFTWPEDKMTVVDHAILYPSADRGDPCNFTEVFTTDGRIAALGLKVIEDDKEAFISYLSSVMMMQDFADQHRELADLFEQIGQPISEDRMVELNARVDVEGEFPADVAEQYLREEGFVQ